MPTSNFFLKNLLTVSYRVTQQMYFKSIFFDKELIRHLCNHAFIQLFKFKIKSPGVQGMRLKCLFTQFPNEFAIHKLEFTFLQQ